MFFIQVLLAKRNVRCESLDDEAGCVDKDASNCRPLWQFGITRGSVNLFTPIHPQLVWETPSSLNIFCKFQISTNPNLPQQLKQPVLLRLKDGSNSISYHAFFNGTDYDPTPGGLEDDLGFPAELHVASVLTFYGLEGSEAVKLHMTTPEVVYP